MACHDTELGLINTRPLTGSCVTVVAASSPSAPLEMPIAVIRALSIPGSDANVTTASANRSRGIWASGTSACAVDSSTQE